jgi:RNA polymerase sigma-70 factor, ECF subfamily
MAESDRTSQFLGLFTAHDRGLRKYILTLLGDRDAAEEVFQETSATMWRKFGEFEPGTNFFAWACRIAYFEVLQFRRRCRRERLVFGAAVLHALSQELPARAHVLEERRRVLPGCVERLSIDDQELIEQRYAGEESVSDIAQRTGRPVQAIYKALWRIRRSLMQCLDEALGQTRVTAEELERVPRP